MPAVGQAKTHCSAVVIIPPQAIWHPIQVLRQKYDRQVHRWMPHINLVYPFVLEEYFEEAAAILAPVLAGVPSFLICLAKFRWFAHPSGRATVWLEPEPAEAVRGLQQVLLRTFPDYDELTRFPQGYTPHLSIGQTSVSGVESFVGWLNSQWKPLKFLVDHVGFIARRGETPFEVRHRIGLAPMNRVAQS